MDEFQGNNIGSCHGASEVKPLLCSVPSFPVCTADNHQATATIYGRWCHRCRIFPAALEGGDNKVNALHLAWEPLCRAGTPVIYWNSWKCGHQLDEGGVVQGNWCQSVFTLNFYVKVFLRSHTQLVRSHHSTANMHMNPGFGAMHPIQLDVLKSLHCLYFLSWWWTFSYETISRWIYYFKKQICNRGIDFNKLLYFRFQIRSDMKKMFWSTQNNELIIICLNKTKKNTRVNDNPSLFVPLLGTWRMLTGQNGLKDKVR